MYQGNEDNSDVDDKRGTRAYPSRTYIGVKASLGEKHPWILEPLNLFWGLLSIHEYAYRFKIPVAKSEMMILDIPKIEYDTQNTNSKGINSIKENDRSIKLNEESIRKMQERKLKAEQWQEIDLGSLTLL